MARDVMKEKALVMVKKKWFEAVIFLSILTSCICMSIADPSKVSRTRPMPLIGSLKR
jgi:hypothetical protein